MKKLYKIAAILDLYFSIIVKFRKWHLIVLKVMKLQISAEITTKLHTLELIFKKSDWLTNSNFGSRGQLWATLDSTILERIIKLGINESRNIEEYFEWPKLILSYIIL